jgi:thiol-disulfide isomerase/thioredoxin
MRYFIAFLVAGALITAVSGQESAAWQELERLEQVLQEKPAPGVNAVEFYAGREKALHDAADAFVKQSPNDPRRAQALLWRMQTTYFPESADQRLELIKKDEADAKALEEDNSLAVDLRSDAVRTVLREWLNNPDLITTREQAEELEKRIGDYVQERPNDPRLVSFQLARANLLLQFEPERGKAFLQQLTNASDSKLADAAKARLKKAELIGKPVDLQFTAADSTKIDLRNFRGKVVLVDFWASWCPDCNRELPTVQKVYDKYKDQGLVLLGISLDKDAKALANFVAKKSLPWPQYFDGKGWDNEFAVKYGVRSIPEMWLVDRQGALVTTFVPIDKLDDQVAGLLGAENKIGLK